MPESAASWLASLTTKYTPTAAEHEAARAHRASVEGRLDYQLGLHEFFEIGSLRHGTGVWYFSDADYLASLKGTIPDSPWTMLNKVKEALQARFTTTTIEIRRPAVVCRFSDGDFEVVPGYAGTSGYYIASPLDGWMLTQPKEHNTWVNRVNNKFNGNVKLLVRQIKTWKYKRNVPVSSCYLEMRTAQYMDGESGYSPLIDLHGALKYLQDKNLAAMNDPTGLGSRFTAYSSDYNRDQTLSRLSTAVNRASLAREYARVGSESAAIEQLKLLFGQ